MAGDSVFNSFNAGLVSDLFAGRIDIKARFAAGRVVRDFFPTALGPLVGRSGTVYMGGVHNSAKRAQLIGLNAASGTNYLVEASEYVFRFWKNNSLLSGSQYNINAVGHARTITFVDAAGGTVGAGDKLLVSYTDHALPVATPVSFTNSGGSLPAEIVSGTIYYICETDFYNNAFALSTTPYGSAITSAAGYTNSGTTTMYDSVIEVAASSNFQNDEIISIDNDSGVTGLAGTWAVKNAHCAPVNITAVDATANTFTVASHGLTTGDKIYITKAIAGTLPAGMTALKAYYAIVVDTNTFKISTDADTTALDITSAGAGNLRLYKVGRAFNNRFQIAPVDGTYDKNPIYTVSGTTTSTKFHLHTQATNSTDFRTTGFSGGVTTYTGAGNSKARWYGKHHHYSESVLFDTSNRFDVGYAILGDSIFFAHNASWPYKLTVTSDYDWSFEPYAESIHDWNYRNTSGYTRIPRFFDGPYDFANSEYGYDVHGMKSSGSELYSISNIHYRQLKGGDGAIFTNSEIGVLLRIEGTPSELNSKIYQITRALDWTNADNWTGTDAYGKLINSGQQNSTWTSKWRKGLLSPASGYPKRIGFAQNRMVLSRFNDHPTRCELSESSNYQSYSPTDPDDWTSVLDDNGISFSITSQSAGSIVWTKDCDQGMYVGCTGGVFLVSGTDSVLLIPGKTTQTLVSSYGAENIPPIFVGADMFYVEVGGRRIRKVTAGAAKTDANDASRLFFDALQSPIVGWTFCKKPVPAIWAWLSDGTIVGIVTEVQDDVFAAFTVDIGGSFSTGAAVVESITTVRNTSNQDELYFSVKRTINGSTVRYIERLADSIFYDSGVTKTTAIHADCAITVTNSPASTSVSGLSHLEGQAVDVVADGVIITGKTVSSGAITLTTAASTIIVGLSYRPAWESLDVEVPEGGGKVSLGTRKRLNAVDVGFYNTLGAKVGRSSSYMNEISFGSYTTTNVSLFTGVKKGPLNGDHTEQARVRIEQVIPAPICINFINVEGQIYG